MNSFSRRHARLTRQAAATAFAIGTFLVIPVTFAQAQTGDGGGSVGGDGGTGLAPSGTGGAGGKGGAGLRPGGFGGNGGNGGTGGLVGPDGNTLSPDGTGG